MRWPHTLRAKMQNIPLQSMHEKEFFILTNMCGLVVAYEPRFSAGPRGNVCVFNSLLELGIEHSWF